MSLFFLLIKLTDLSFVDSGSWDETFLLMLLLIILIAIFFLACRAFAKYFKWFKRNWLIDLGLWTLNFFSYRFFTFWALVGKVYIGWFSQWYYWSRFLLAETFILALALAQRALLIKVFQLSRFWPFSSIHSLMKGRWLL